jgi:hypothetical protein
VLSQNLVHGDALTMLTHDGRPLTFPEWGYLGKGKFQRRDFRFDVLTGSSAFSEEGTRHRFLSFFRQQLFASGAFYAQQLLSLSRRNVGNHLTLALTACAAERQAGALNSRLFFR